jgi:hypothetical protein
MIFSDKGDRWGIKKVSDFCCYGLELSNKKVLDSGF